MRVTHLERSDFLDNYADIRPGEHVNIIQPTGGGKSWFAHQLMRKMMHDYPGQRYVSMMPKPMDETTSAWAPALGLKEIHEWPPSKRFWEDVPPGYVLWPRHMRDESQNKERLHQMFSEGMNDQYFDGHSTTMIDDAYLVGVHLGCNQLLDRHWIAGRSSGAGLITCLQKPSGTVSGAVSSFAYDSPTHLFFGRDNDQRNLQRISEISISQLDPREVMEIVKRLPVHRINDSAVSEMLYIDRRGPYMATIGV